MRRAENGRMRQWSEMKKKKTKRKGLISSRICKGGFERLNQDLNEDLSCTIKRKSRRKVLMNKMKKNSTYKANKEDNK